MSVRLNPLPDLPRKKETMLTRVNPLSHLPEEVSLQIFSYLNPLELGRCHLVSREWHVLASTDTLWKALTPAMAFGKKKWETYFGEVGEEPPLPRNIHQILRSPCPFWKDKRVEETHLLLLIPKTVSGEPLSLRSLKELIKAPKKGGPATQYRYFWNKGMEQYGDHPVEESYWILITKNILPNSRNKPLEQHQAYLQQYSFYDIPKAIEASTALFLEYVVSQTRLFSDSPMTYTRCQEMVGSLSLFVGGFTLGGLAVNDFCLPAFCGVGGCRKL